VSVVSFLFPYMRRKGARPPGAPTKWQNMDRDACVQCCTGTVAAYIHVPFTSLAAAAVACWLRWSRRSLSARLAVGLAGLTRAG
jgi:hypothetical protein